MQIRTKRLLRTTLVISSVALLTYGLGWSNLIAVDSIIISGTQERKLVTAQLMTGGSNIKMGEPLARINPRSESNLIEDLEWISSAKISRNWLSGQVSLQITERIPVAVFQESSSTSGPRYLSSNGIEFSSPKKFSGLAEINLGQKTRSERRVIAQFVSELSPQLIASLKGLEISAENEVKMESKHNGRSVLINWGAGNSVADLAVKSRVLVALLALPENKKISEVDLSIANSPIVR